jgi:hypothetical protein
VGKSFSDTIELEGVHGLHNDEKMMRALGNVAREAQDAADEHPLDGDRSDLVRKVEEYATRVDEVCSVLQERSKVLEKVADEGNQLVTGIEDLLKTIPLHVVLDANSSAAQQAERWMDENGEGDHHFIGILNVCIIVFTSVADWTLFKVMFSA